MTLREVYERLQRLDRGEIGYDAFSMIGLTNAYIFCSFAYYERDESLVGDIVFDKLCKHLYDNWDFLEAEGVRDPYKLLIEDNVKAGTCLGVVWPTVIREMSDALIDMKRADHIQNATQLGEFDI